MTEGTGADVKLTGLSGAEGDVVRTGVEEKLYGYTDDNVSSTSTWLVDPDGRAAVHAENKSQSYTRYAGKKDTPNSGIPPRRVAVCEVERDPLVGTLALHSNRYASAISLM